MNNGYQKYNGCNADKEVATLRIAIVYTFKLKKMKLIIKKTDLLENPCERYKNLHNQFDAIEEITKRGNRSGDVVWLIAHCEFAQNYEMLEYYKSLNPSFDDVSWLITIVILLKTMKCLSITSR
jgi:hypothetical protein